MKPLLSKEEFCKIINKLKTINDLYEELDCCYNKYKNLLGGCIEPYSLEISCENEIIKLLEIIMNDKPTNDYYGSNISYFIYELNYGKNYKAGMVTDKNKDGSFIDVDISTPEKLYEYLIKNMEQNETL